MRNKIDTRVKLSFGTEYESVAPKLNIGSLRDIEFHVNIIYSIDDAGEFIIQILYEPHIRLYDIIRMFLDQNFDILNIIKPTYEYQDTIIDLSNSELLEVEDDNGHWENGYRFIILKIDKGRIVFTRNLLIPSSKFSLSRNCLPILDSLYTISGFSHENPHSFTADDSNLRPISFGPYQFQMNLDFQLFQGEEFNELIASRWPEVHISENGSEFISDEEGLLKFVDVLILLISFLYGDIISYNYAQINKESGFTDIVISSSEKSKSQSGLNPKYEIDFEEIKSFFDNCNYDFISGNFEFIRKVIQRYIFTKDLEGESKFMVLYNILEQIRNFYITLSDDQGSSFIVGEEYSFTVSKTQTEKRIKEKIKEVGDIVDQSERDEFKKNANKKVSFIKKKLMMNQFVQFFNYLNLDLSEFDLDFQELLKIRNTIFHGHDLQQTLKVDLQVVTMRLEKLVESLIKNLIEES